MRRLKGVRVKEVRESSTSLRGLTRPGAVALGTLDAEALNNP